jgi:hypothetical protein
VNPVEERRRRLEEENEKINQEIKELREKIVNHLKSYGDSVSRQTELYKKISNRLLELNEGWWPDWSNEDFKFSLRYDHEYKQLIAKKNTFAQYFENGLYAKNNEIWMQIIDEFGKEDVVFALFGMCKI